MIHIARNKTIRQFTTFGIGGKAEFFCEVRTPRALREVIAWAKDRGVQWRLIAGGSNVVLRDGVIPGLLIRIAGGSVRSMGDGMCYADAGVPLTRLVTFSTRHGLSGLESLAGIPGTVGGAIVGNAGAYGHSIEEIVSRVRVWDGKGDRWIAPKDCAFAYRESIFKHNRWIVLGAEFVFTKGDAQELIARSKHIIAERLKKYPRGLRCPGSYFKNVPVTMASPMALGRIDASKIIAGKIPAGYLLEAVGAKGMRRGDIMVAEYHGNLILNCGRGSARDVRALAAELKARVKKRFGIVLEEEVRYS